MCRFPENSEWHSTATAGERDMNLEENKQQLTLAIAEHLCQMEDLCKEWNLPNLTSIARDPKNDKMIIIVTNERGSYKPALDAALKQVSQDKAA